MMIIIIGIVLTLVGVIWLKYHDLSIGAMIMVTFGMFALLTVGILLLIKPIELQDFKAKYEVYKNTETSSIDIRDTNYKITINEINKEIILTKNIRNNIWYGIFQNYEIGDYELIKLEESETNVK